jgi:hypothetical protein
LLLLTFIVVQSGFSQQSSCAIVPSTNPAQPAAQPGADLAPFQIPFTNNLSVSQNASDYRYVCNLLKRSIWCLFMFGNCNHYRSHE